MAPIPSNPDETGDRDRDHTNPQYPHSFYGQGTGLVLLLGRVEAKLDSALLWIQRHEEKVSELDKRIDHLERGRAYILGLVLAISVGITAVGAVLNPKDFIQVTPAPPKDYSQSQLQQEDTEDVSGQ